MMRRLRHGRTTSGQFTGTICCVAKATLRTPRTPEEQQEQYATYAMASSRFRTQPFLQYACIAADPLVASTEESAIEAGARRGAELACMVLRRSYHAAFAVHLYSAWAQMVRTLY